MTAALMILATCAAASAAPRRLESYGLKGEGKTGGGAAAIQKAVDSGFGELRSGAAGSA